MCDDGWVLLLDLDGPAGWGGDDPGAVGVVEVGVRVQRGTAHTSSSSSNYIFLNPFSHRIKILS